MRKAIDVANESIWGKAQGAPAHRGMGTTVTADSHSINRSDMIEATNIFTEPAIKGRIDMGSASHSAETAMFLYDIEPGGASYPYHYECAEEWMLVIEGEVTVRTPEGEHVVPLGKADIKRGSPLDYTRIRKAQETIEQLLGQKGFLDAEVKVDVKEVSPGQEATSPACKRWPARFRLPPDSSRKWKGLRRSRRKARWRQATRNRCRSLIS